MSKWLNLAWLVKELPFGCYIFERYLMYWPGLQNRVHAQMTEIEYRQWHPDLITNKGISCYQCGGTAKANIALSHQQCGIACAHCKSILWRKAATV